jgi:single-strand DNA-binding protein
MSSRASLNKVLLIGNLTRDPELRYTPSGAAVCSFGVATNRVYTSSDGQKKEEVEFTKIVAWGKLGELCSQLLTKGRKVFVEGRMQTRSWETPDGQNRQTTEVVIDDMRILDSRKDFGEGAAAEDMGEVIADAALEEKAPIPESDEAPEPKKAKAAKDEKPDAVGEDQKVDLDDLPF